MAASGILSSAEAVEAPRATPADSARRARFGLAYRFAILATALVGVTAAAIAVVMYRGAADALVEREGRDLAGAVHTASQRLATLADFAMRDVRFLVRAFPPGAPRFAETAPDSSGIDRALFEQRLSALFSAMLESRPSYQRIHFALVGSDGRDVLGIERTAEGSARMQPDPSRFAATLEATRSVVGLEPGGALIGPVTEDPATARLTFSVAAPLADATGDVRGALIVDIDATGWLETVAAGFTRDQVFAVIGDGRSYLFRSDGAGGGTTPRFLPEPAFIVARSSPSFSGFVAAAGREDLVVARRMEVEPGNPASSIVLAAILDPAVLFADIAQLRTTTVIISAALVLAAALLAVLLARAVARPLRELTRVATEVAGGERHIDIGAVARRSDEAGVLARAFATMTERIGEREEEIRAKAEALERSNQELSQFAYVASHDLQEPLRMVASYLGLLARRYRGRLDAEADEFIGFAVDGAERMKRLINDLLAYSRVSNRPLALETVNMTALAVATTDVLADRLAECGGEVAVGSLPKLTADPVQMERLLINLVENGVKYRSEAPPRICIEAKRSGRHWLFSVTDNGIGIAPEFREKIFEIFARLHSRDRYAGTGIGLASCRRIVERHGGAIWADAAPGGGSVFLFTLPASGPNQGNGT